MQNPPLPVLTLLVPLALAAIPACGDSDSSPANNGGGGGNGGGAPEITSVSVEGSTGAQVRQGYGDAPTSVAATVHLNGNGLDAASSVTVGSLPGEITEKTPTVLTFTLRVPHGAPLGPQPISVTSERGPISIAQGLTITPITAAPNGVDPGKGPSAASGTDEGPFRSLGHALSVASAGDTVLLKDGAYDHEHGDDFAVADATGNALPTVPAGVTVKGESAAAKLVGSQGKAAGLCNAHFQFGLVLAENTRIETLDVSEFCVGIIAKTGAVTIQGVSVHDIRGDGMNLGGAANISLDGVIVSSNHAEGIYVADTATTTFTNGHLFSNGYSDILSSTSGSLTVTGTELNNGTHEAIYVGKTSAPSKVTITDVHIHDHTWGLNAFAGNGSPQLTITGTKFDTSEVAVHLGGSWAVKARTSTFQGSNAGVWLSSSTGGSLDFGTNESHGDNTFNVSSIGIRDDITHPDATSPITVTGNTWIGPQPVAGCWTKDDHPTEGVHNWTISNPGTCPSKGNVIIN